MLLRRSGNVILVLVSRTEPNPYEVLGVDRDADQDKIRAAYRRLALEYHPDRNPGNSEAEERFKELSTAYATLRDPEARVHYDRYGRRPGTETFQAVDWQTIFREADLRIDLDARGGIPQTGNAVFDFLFGAVTGAMRFSGLLPGQDRCRGITVPLELARHGGLQRVRVPGPSVCPTCGGRGRGYGGGICQACAGRRQLASAEVDLTIPAGVRDGVKLRLKGLGGLGAPPGDALFTVQVGLPEGVRRVGNDLHTDLFLTPLEAARGAKVEVVGVSVTVPEGVCAGQVLTFPSKGLSGGDLVLTVQFDVWRGLWRTVKSWTRRLSPV